jgi:hypothetical protein
VGVLPLSVSPPISTILAEFPDKDISVSNGRSEGITTSWCNNMLLRIFGGDLR